MTELTPAQRRDLRARAHHLNPVVTIADNGLAPSVVAEIERSLQAHELIKVKVQGAEREQRDTLMQELCAALDAAPVQHIGNILVLWREKPEAPKSAVTTRRSKPMTKKQAAARLEARSRK